MCLKQRKYINKGQTWWHSKACGGLHPDLYPLTQCFWASAVNSLFTTALRNGSGGETVSEARRKGPKGTPAIFFFSLVTIYIGLTRVLWVDLFNKCAALRVQLNPGIEIFQSISLSLHLQSISVALQYVMGFICHFNSRIHDDLSSDCQVCISWIWTCGVWWCFFKHQRCKSHVS